MRLKTKLVVSATGLTFAIVLVLFGVEHFVYTRYTPGIPSWSFVEFWVPGALLWGYVLFAGTGRLARQRKRFFSSR